MLRSFRQCNIPSIYDIREKSQVQQQRMRNTGSNHNHNRNEPFISFKASDLLRDLQVRENLRITNYKTEFHKCLDAVKTVNEHSRKQYTLYSVPLVLPGDPNFELEECISYLKSELSKAEFYVKLMQGAGNVLFISWKPEHITLMQEKARKRMRKEKEREEQEKEKEKEREKEQAKAKQRQVNPAVPEEPSSPRVLEFHPKSALSHLSLRSSLMKDNPKYAHLKSLQRLKGPNKGKNVKKSSNAKS